MSQQCERATRKKRATNAEIRSFVKWCFDNDAFNKWTAGKIRQVYLDECKVDLSVPTIHKQRDRWIMIGEQVYDVNKPWLIPKNTEV